MSSRARWLAVALPALLVVGAWWGFVWSQRADAVASAEGQTEQLRDDAARTRTALLAARRFHDGGQASRDRLTALREQLPTTADLGGFIRQHDDLVRSAGVTVESMSPGSLDDTKRDPTTPPGTTASKVAITVSGSAWAMSDYLSGLFALRRMVVVDRFDWSSSGDGNVRMDLDLRIFQIATSLTSR